MGEDIRAGSLITIDQGLGQHSLVYCSEQDGRCQMGKEIDDTQAKVSFPYGWRKGDTCVIITNKAKKSTSEYIVESYDGVYFGVRSHTGLYHRVSPWRMFQTKEDALESLAEQKYGSMSL